MPHRRVIYNMIYNIINDIELDIGQSKRMNCPECNGYKTFTISNQEGNIIWNCYKLTCKLKGSRRVGMSVNDIQNRLKNTILNNNSFELPEYIIPVSTKHDSVYAFARKWFIDIDLLMYDVRDDRAVFCVRHNNKIVDAVGRTLCNAYPKWRRYGNSTYPFTHKQMNSYGAVVVEDCISAVVVASKLPCEGVALMGTTLSDGHKKYLCSFDNVIVALDPDAAKKTLDITKQLRPYIKNVQPYRLHDDIKYQDQDDLYKLKGMIERWS